LNRPAFQAKRVLFCVCDSIEPTAQEVIVRGQPHRIFIGWGSGAMKILIIEDDQEAAESIAARLRTRDHEATVARSAREGFERAIGGFFDAIVLDRILPDLDGLSVVSLLRAEGVSTPVLFLTILSGVDDRVQGLEAGGDDYLAKPFAFDELMARLIALARRPALGSLTTSLRAGDLEMDLVERTVRRGGERIDLHPREFRVLELLLRNEGRVISRKMLLERVWEYHFDPQTNIVETHISRLRTKIDGGHRPPLIQTLRGAGYTLRAPQATP
jgi:two-component system, OmpR family, response regulator